MTGPIVLLCMTSVGFWTAPGPEPGAFHYLTSVGFGTAMILYVDIAALSHSLVLYDVCWCSDSPDAFCGHSGSEP